MNHWMYLFKKQITPARFENYPNIIRYTPKLVSLNRLDTAVVQAFWQSVEAEEHLKEREWLLEMVG